MTDQRIYTIADHYGLRHQCAKAREELKELVEALEVFEGKWTPDTFVHVAEEIADVEIMTKQLKHLMANAVIVRRFKNQKLERQLNRIAQQSINQELTSKKTN